MYWLIPFVDRVVRVDQRIITYQLELQETITRDGVAVRVNAVLWFRADSPVQVVTSVEDWRSATVQAAETALRDAIGQSDLDLMLKDRASINHRLQQLLRDASLKWGVEIDLVEIKDVDIPEQMQRAIAREAEAVREKRARIVRAEGEQEAAAKLASAAETIGMVLEHSNSDGFKPLPKSEWSITARSSRCYRSSSSMRRADSPVETEKMNLNRAMTVERRKREEEIYA